MNAPRLFCILFMNFISSRLAAKQKNKFYMALVLSTGFLERIPFIDVHLPQ